nr:hypothetical protein Iba_chr05cCG19740 [Ipomoea batatas]
MNVDGRIESGIGRIRRPMKTASTLREKVKSERDRAGLVAAWRCSSFLSSLRSNASLLVRFYESLAILADPRKYNISLQLRNFSIIRAHFQVVTGYKTEYNITNKRSRVM